MKVLDGFLHLSRTEENLLELTITVTSSGFFKLR